MHDVSVRSWPGASGRQRTRRIRFRQSLLHTRSTPLPCLQAALHYSPSMGMVTALANQKGGTGKTTTTLSLASALAAAGKFVLLVDMDPQGNMTSGLGVENDPEQGVYAALMGAPPAKMVRQTSIPCVDILGTGPELSGASIELVNLPQREFRLRQVLTQLRPNYDVVLIDCPPTLGLLTINALVAADNVLIPVQCEYFALEGLGQLLRTVQLVKERLQPGLEVLGAVMTMYDKRLKLSQDVVAEVRKNFPHRVFEAIVPRNIRLAEAPGFGKTVLETAPWSKGARAYKQLAEEVAFLLPQ